MLIALFADIHANVHALEACIAHARDRGAERFAFLGDLVGYGADAREVVGIVSREVERGAIAIKGNHDEAVQKSQGYFNEAATAAIDWARRTLTPEDTPGGGLTMVLALPRAHTVADAAAEAS